MFDASIEPEQFIVSVNDCCFLLADEIPHFLLAPLSRVDRFERSQGIGASSFTASISARESIHAVVGRVCQARVLLYTGSLYQESFAARAERQP
jgi:hypothetical protein